MKILRSQLKQVITEELNGLLKEIEENFDGETGEPKTVKGALICATNEDCWYKWLEDSVKEMIFAEDERLKEPMWKAILARGEDGGWYKPGFYAPSKSNKEKQPTGRPDASARPEEKEAAQKVEKAAIKTAQQVKKKVVQNPTLAPAKEEGGAQALIKKTVAAKLKKQREDLEAKLKADPENTQLKAVVKALRAKEEALLK